MRTDMGSNPELLRQSTHSLLHKPNLAKQNEATDDDGPADLIILQQKGKQSRMRHSQLSLEADDEGLDEIVPRINI